MPYCAVLGDTMRHYAVLCRSRHTVQSCNHTIDDDDDNDNDDDDNDDDDDDDGDGQAVFLHHTRTREQDMKELAVTAADTDTGADSCTT